MKKATKEVEQILREKPYTRNSDGLLYAAYLELHGYNSVTIPYLTVVSLVTNKVISSAETIGRIRRKLVEEYPELKGNSNVEAYRSMLEEDFREFAMEVIV